MTARKSTPLWYDVWPTAWGPMGAVASDAGIRATVLPHYQPDDLADLLTWNHPGAQRSPTPFERLIERSRAYFNAVPTDFADVTCELPPETTFAGKVLRACRDIPDGQTRNYGAIAKQIGRPEAARAVAAALGKNPLPLVIPCHRVIYAGGKVGGFSAPGGTDQKRRMLEMERAAADGG